jgi:hypothetical protein
MSDVGSIRELLTALRHWPARRWVAVSVLAGPLTLLYLQVGPPVSRGWAVPASVVCGVLAAMVLASYLPLPRSRRLIDLGCTPCSTVAFATVIGSLMIRSSDPLAPGMALLAIMALLFGLVQRLSGSLCTVAGKPGPAAVTRSAGTPNDSAGAGNQDVVAPTM